MRSRSFCRKEAKVKHRNLLRASLLAVVGVASACVAPQGNDDEGDIGSVSSALTTTYQGESMTYSGTEGGTGEVRTSPAPTHRYFWTDSYVTQSHTFGGGSATITVRAMGESNATMHLYLDGVSVGSTVVSNTAYTDYAYTASPTAGAHTIKVAFEGDTGPNNLLLDYVTVDESAAGCTDTTYEGESMTVISGTGQTGGTPNNRWFFSNGAIATNHTFVAGQRIVRVRAAGDPAGSIWPHMTVSVNGVAIGNVDVNTPTTDYRYYSFPFTATAGSQEVRVTYDNDGVVGTQDRGLHVDNVQVLCSGMTFDSGTRSTLFPTTWQPGNKFSGNFLQDYSYAGYNYGATPPVGSNPRGLPVINVSTVAQLNSAITTANGSGNPNGTIISIAAGHYVLTSSLATIQHSGVVLRGAGAGSTFLEFQGSLAGDQSSIRFSGSSTAATSNANWNIIESFHENDRTLSLTSESGLAVGDEIEVGWTNTSAFRAAHHPVSSTSEWTNFNAGSWVSFFRRKVVAIDSSKHRIVVDIPLRYTVDITTGWGSGVSPAVRRLGATSSSYITECGVESLSIANAVAWNTAWSSDQNSAIRFDKAENCWVSNVESYNPGTQGNYHLQSDGIRLEGSRLMTIQHTKMQWAQNRSGAGNGYLFDLGTGNHDNLLSDLTATNGRHGFIVNSYSFGTSGNVLTQVTTEASGEYNTSSPAIPASSYTAWSKSGSDFHNALTMANLVERANINDGFFCKDRGTLSGGAGNTCTQNTFWNDSGSGTGDRRLRSWQFQTGYVIGTTNLNTIISDDGSGGYANTAPNDYTEMLNLTGAISPVSLYAEQRARRLLNN